LSLRVVALAARLGRRTLHEQEKGGGEETVRRACVSMKIGWAKVRS
jgi:hypothetical protein